MKDTEEKEKILIAVSVKEETRMPNDVTRIKSYRPPRLPRNNKKFSAHPQITT